MSHRSDEPSLCVITPTYRRETLLRRFLKRICKQTYRNWRLVVVHDGPNPSTEGLVSRFRADDPRIEYTHTATRTNDTGVSPRHEGARHAIAQGPPDYCVFWDDDNYFALDALELIVDALDSAVRPDLLMVSMQYGTRILPPRDVPVSALVPGQVDTANLVISPRLALAAYADVLREKAENPGKDIYTSDYMVFDFLRRQRPVISIGQALDVLVGFHDGLRWRPYIRHLLGIPPLHLADRHRLLARVIRR
jgi:glycosyltransferase involved in cell wall biosynthesis